MYSPAGLEGWEIVAASGLCAAGFLCVATLIGVTIAYFTTREPSTVRETAKAHPAPAQSVFGTPVAAPASAA
jgi:hypothetical protein